MSILGSLGLGALDTLFSGVSSLFGARKQDYYQRRQMSIANDYANQMFDRQIDFWNMQNDYNSPAQQMSRLEAAGLNPNLVYGNGSMANTSNSGMPSSSVPSNHGPSVSMPQSRLMQSYLMSIQGDSYRAGIRRTEEDIEVLREQANKLRTEQLLNLSSVDARNLSNRLLRETFAEEVERVRIANEEAKQRIAQSQSTEAVNYKTLEEIDARIAEKAAHIRSLDAGARLSHANAYMQELTASFLNRTGFLPSSAMYGSWINEICEGLNVEPKELINDLGKTVKYTVGGSLGVDKFAFHKLIAEVLSKYFKE